MSQYFVYPYKMSIEVCYNLFYERKQAETFSSLQKLPLLIKSLCFQQPLKHWWNDLITSLAIVRLPSRLLETIPWGLSHSNIRLKSGQEVFLTGKFAFFFQKKLCFQQPLICWRNDPIPSTVIVRLSFGPLKTVPWGLSNSNIREKTAQFFSSLEGFPFFFKKLCFQQHLRSWRNDLISFTVFVKKPCAPSLVVPGGLVHSIIRWKTAQKIFVIVKNL